jgi:hypothetical protein
MPVLQTVVQQTFKAGFNLREVSADKAYISMKNLQATVQVNEALCKVLCHNLCVVIQSMYELGIDATFTAEAASEI